MSNVVIVDGDGWGGAKSAAHTQDSNLISNHTSNSADRRRNSAALLHFQNIYNQENQGGHNIINNINAYSQSIHHSLPYSLPNDTPNGQYNVYSNAGGAAANTPPNTTTAENYNGMNNVIHKKASTVSRVEMFSQAAAAAVSRNTFGLRSENARPLRTPVDVLATYVNTSERKKKEQSSTTPKKRTTTTPKSSVTNLFGSKWKLSSSTLQGSVEEEKEDESPKLVEDTSVPPLPPIERQLSSSSSLGERKREHSGEWGWFADIDSSTDSLTDGIAPSMRRLYNLSHTSSDNGGSSGTSGDIEIILNQRITAAHKTFAWNTDGNASSSTSNNNIVSAAISIPKFRIVQSSGGSSSSTNSDRHAEYLVTFALGSCYYSDWRRYSEFAQIQMNPLSCFPRSNAAWNAIDSRWFNRLEPSYLHRKCISLEGFLRELMYESVTPELLLDFLGNDASKVVNRRPKTTTTVADVVAPAATRTEEPSCPAQLPKDLRPPQPVQERELFEKIWADNFKRSNVVS